MTTRRGAARGTGRGYRNLRGFPKDPFVHSQSAKGRKQPQKIPNELQCFEGLERLGALSKDGKDMLKKLRAENIGAQLKNIREQKDEMTNSDLQGVVGALALRKLRWEGGYDSNDLKSREKLRRIENEMLDFVLKGESQ
jgi:hypothetical protein